MAFVILMIAIVPLSYMLDSTVSSAANARQRQAALQLAESWIEILSNSTPPLDANHNVITNTPTTPVAPAGAQTPISLLAGTQYSVKANYTLQSVNNGSQSDLCEAGQPPNPSHPGVIVLQVTVTWNHGKQSLADTTNIEYPQPGVQTDGFLAIQLSNSPVTDIHNNTYKARIESIPVTVTDTNTNTSIILHPDTNGCIFAQVAPDTYDVSVGVTPGQTPSLPGYSGTPAFVTVDGQTSESVSGTLVSVTGQSTVTLPAFDEGIATDVSYGSSTPVEDGVWCPGSNVAVCASAGSGASNATLSWGGSSGTWNSASVSAAARIDSLDCTTSGNPICIAVGNDAGGGVILSTSTNLGTRRADAVPAGVTAISQVTCPSDHGCYAIGTTATGPVLLAGAIGIGDSQTDTWAIMPPPTGVTYSALTGLACPASTTCELAGSGVVGNQPPAPGILRLDGNPSALANNAAWSPLMTPDNMPTGLVSVGKVVCPSSTLCEAIGTGDANGATDPTVVTALITPTGNNKPVASTWVNEAPFAFPATGTTTLTDLSCSATTCMAIGANSSPGVTTPEAWSGELATHDWELMTLPAAVTGVSAVACGDPGTDTADCAVTATTGSSSAPGALFDASLTLGTWAWNQVTVATPSPVLFFTGVDCQLLADTSHPVCAAAGATADGAVTLASSGGPRTGWSVTTPTNLTGASVTGIPLETVPASQTNWTTQVPFGGVTNATSLPNPLYPQQNGYSIAAGDCVAVTTAGPLGSFSASPGGTASAVVPLGLLPLQVEASPGGLPVSGATMTITTTSGCTSHTYTLPSTDVNGLSRTSVPFGSYSLSITSGGTTKSYPLNVGQSSVSVGGTSFPLPGPASVTF